MRHLHEFLRLCYARGACLSRTLDPDGGCDILAWEKQEKRRVEEGMGLFYSAVMAGVMTGIGGAAFLGALDMAVGSLLFSIGMFACLALGLPLYVGRCAPAFFGKPRATNTLPAMLAGNLLGAVACGLVFGMAIPSKAALLQEAKLAQPFLSTLVRGTLCGMILFTGAHSWKTLQSGKPVGVLLGVTAFIIAGFENSIADTFYFAAALGQGGAFQWQTLPFLLAAILGNTLGAVLLYLAVPEYLRATTPPSALPPS